MNTFLNPVIAWARTRPDIHALLLIGSHASGQSTPKSDIDLIFLVDEPSYYMGKDEWLHQFGPVRAVQDEQWGVVSTRRVFYREGEELEFNFATPAWAALPLDAGTRHVLKDGHRVLFAREPGLEEKLKQGILQG